MSGKDRLSLQARTTGAFHDSVLGPLLCPPPSSGGLAPKPVADNSHVYTSSQTLPGNLDPCVLFLIGPLCFNVLLKLVLFKL